LYTQFDIFKKLFTAIKYNSWEGPVQSWRRNKRSPRAAKYIRMEQWRNYQKLRRTRFL